MPQPIVLDIELTSIRGFLERVFKSCDEDYLDVARRNEMGEFATIDDWENAYYGALSSEELAIRSVMGELNAIIVWEVQAVALTPYYNKTPIPQKRKPIWDLKWNQLCQLISEGYVIDISTMDSYQEVLKLRRTVNAFKHRKGFRDFQRDPVDESVFPPDRYEVDREAVFAFIAATRRFLMALWNTTGIR